MVSNANDDFPDPDKPVRTTNLSLGISTSTAFKLCSLAERTLICELETKENPPEHQLKQIGKF